MAQLSTTHQRSSIQVRRHVYFYYPQITKCYCIKGTAEKRQFDNISQDDSSGIPESSSPSFQSKETIKKRKSSGVSGITILECFFASMCTYLIDQVTKVFANENKRNDLKEKFLNKNLPPKITKTAQVMSKCPSGEIAKYF
jgi:hypothetical protein